MEDTNSFDNNRSKNVKNSSDSKDNNKTTGDSEVQDGEGVERPEQEVKGYDKSDDQQEYIEQANDNTEVANESPVKDGKGMTN